MQRKIFFVNIFFFGSKQIRVKQFFGPEKKFWVIRNFGSKKFQVKIKLIKKEFLGQKRNFRAKKIVGKKYFSGQKIFVRKNIFCPQFFWP